MLVARQLHFTVRALAQTGLLGLKELEVGLGDVRQHTLDFQLLRRQITLIISLFNEWRGLLNALHVLELDGVSGARALTSALELMPLEPVLLIASLRAILYDIILVALGTRKEWDPLLVELAVLARLRRILLIFQKCLQRALVVRALTHVYHLVVWRNEVLFAQASDGSRALVAILTDLQLLLARLGAFGRECVLLDL